MADLTLSVAFNPGDLQNAINSVINRTYNIRGINVNSIQQPLGRITASASEFEKSMEAANARVLAFGASAGAIFVVKKAFDMLISSTIDVESKMVEINSVLGLSSKQLGNFSSQVFAAANSVSVSFSDASKAALEFARQGLSVEETLKRTRDSLILAKVAGIDFADSANAITAALNSFSNEVLKSSDLVDRLTNADANFAVSAGDLAEAIKRVGSSAADANVSLNQTIALVTAAQQTTSRGGSVIGNSFKTIFTRLGRSSVLADLENLGVATKNASGDTLPLVQILKNLSSTYDSLSSYQKNFAAELVGGVYQINILKATVSDLGKSGSVYEAALKTIENSTGSAERRINELNQSLSAKLNVTLNKTIELASAIGSKTISPIFKGVLDQANSGLGSLTNSIDGEGIGSKIANGMLGGLKGILQGPGAALIGFFATKLAGNFGGFLSSSIASFSGMNNAAQQQAQIQQQIVRYLQSNPSLLEDIHSGATTVSQAHSLILSQIRAQNALLDYQAGIAAQIGGRMGASGVTISPATPAPRTPAPRTPAAGFIPNFNSQMAGQMMENAGAREHKGGYTAGKAYKTTVHDGNGNAIPTFVNSREKVENFTNSAGYKATMVTPPNGFGKGTMRAAGGFIPNFAPMTTVYRGVNPRVNAGAGAGALYQALGLGGGAMSKGIMNRLIGAIGPNYTDDKPTAEAFGKKILSKKVNDKKLLRLGTYDEVAQLFAVNQHLMTPGLAGRIKNSTGEEQQAAIEQAGGELRAILKKRKFSGIKSPLHPADAKYLSEEKGLVPGNLVIPFAGGFVPNFAKGDRGFKNEGKLGIGFAKKDGGPSYTRNYKAGMYSLSSSAQAKLRGKEEEPMVYLSGVINDPLNFNPNKLIGDAKQMKGDQSTHAKAGFLLEKRIGTNTSPNAPIDIRGVNEQISMPDRKKFSIDSSIGKTKYEDLELKLQETTISPANIISKYVNAYHLSGGFVPNFSGQDSLYGGRFKTPEQKKASMLRGVAAKANMSSNMARWDEEEKRRLASANQAVTGPNKVGGSSGGFVPNFGPKPRVGSEGEERELGRGSGRRAFLRYKEQGTATPTNAYVIKPPHRTGERRPEAVIDAMGQQQQSEDFAAGLKKFPWFEAVPQKHVGGGVLEQPLARGDTLGQVLREAYPNYGTSAISGVLGSFDQFFQKIGLYFDKRGMPGNIIIPDERKQQLMQILKGPVGTMYARMFGHKGGFPMDADPDAKPGDKPEPWFKLIDYSKGFIPNFGKKRLINQEGGASDAQRERLTEMFASVTREEPIGASALAFEMLEGNRGTPWVDQALADFETFKNHYTNDYTNNAVTTSGMDLNDPENVAFLRGQWGSRYFKKKIGKKGIFDRNHLLNPGTRPTAAGGFVPNFNLTEREASLQKDEKAGLLPHPGYKPDMGNDIPYYKRGGPSQMDVANMPYYEREAHLKRGRSGGGFSYSGGFVPNFARVLDFDGTLGTAPEGITHKDTYHGWSASKMIPTPLVDTVRKEQEASRKAGKPIEDIIVTARGRESIPYINEWLKNQGLSVAEIRATGDKERYPEGMTTPDKKVLEIKDTGMLKPGTIFSDDDKKNLTAAKRAAKEAGVKGFKTNLVNYGNKGIGQMAGGLIPNFGMVSAQVSALNKRDARNMSKAISGENADPKRQKQQEEALKFEELSALAVGNKMMSDYPVTSLTSIPTKNLKGAAGFGGGKNFPGYDSIYKLLTSNEDLARILGVQINQPSYVPLSAKGGSNIKIAEIKRQMEKGGQVISALKKNGGLEDLDVGNSILAQNSSPAKGIPGLFSDKGSFGKPGYVSRIARASGGFVPNFYNPEERGKKLEQRVGLIDPKSPEGIASAKALENFKARQAVSEGLNDADQKFITDNEKGILRAYRIGALEYGSDFMNTEAGEPNSTYASRGGLPGGIADKLREIVGKKGGRTAVSDLARNRGVTALAGGFVPNFKRESMLGMMDPWYSTATPKGRKRNGVQPMVHELHIDPARGLYNPATKKVLVSDSKSRFNETLAHEEFGHKMFGTLMKTKGFSERAKGPLQAIKGDSSYGAALSKMSPEYEQHRNGPAGPVLEEAFAQSIGSRFDKNYAPGKDKQMDVLRGLTSSLITPRMEKRIRKYLEKNGDRLYDSLSKTKLPANKAKVKFSEMAAGFVPNFNALKDAVGREESGLRSRGINPSGKIYFGTHPSLPNGGIANKVDEPMGIEQGVSRAMSEGRSPRTYGTSGGFVPNFAEDDNSNSGIVALTSAMLGSISAIRQNGLEVRQGALAARANTDAMRIANNNSDKAAKYAGMSISQLQQRQNRVRNQTDKDNLGALIATRQSQERLLSEATPSTRRRVTGGLLATVPNAIAGSMKSGPEKAGMEVLGEASSLASTALLTIAGPYGKIAAGAIILAGAIRANYIANISLGEKGKALAEVMKEQQKNFETGGQEVIKAHQTYADALYNTSISSEMVGKLSQEIAVAMEKIPASLRRDFESRIKLASSQEEKTRIFTEMNQKLIKDQEVTDNLAQSSSKSEGIGQSIRDALAGSNNRYQNTEFVNTTPADQIRQKKALDKDVFSVTASATDSESKRKKYETLVDPSSQSKNVGDFRNQLSNLVPPEAKAMIMGLSDAEIALYQARMRQIEATRKQSEMISEVSKKYIDAERERSKQSQAEINLVRDRSNSLKKLADAFSTMGIGFANAVKVGKIDSQTKSFGSFAGNEKRSTGLQTQAIIDAQNQKVQADSVAMQQLSNSNSQVFKDLLSKGTSGPGAPGSESSADSLTDNQRKANLAIQQAMSTTDTTKGTPKEVIQKIKDEALKNAKGDPGAQKEINDKLQGSGGKELEMKLEENNVLAAQQLKVNEDAKQEQIKTGIALAKVEQNSKAFGGIENFLDKGKTREDNSTFRKSLRASGSGNQERAGRGSMQLILSAQKDLGGALSTKNAGALQETAISARASQIRREATKRISSINKSNIPQPQKRALIGAYQEARGNSREIARTQVEEAAKLERAPLEQLKRLDTIAQGFSALNNALVNSGIVLKRIDDPNFFTNASEGASKGNKDANARIKVLAEEEGKKKDAATRVSSQGNDVLRSTEFAAGAKKIQERSLPKEAQNELIRKLLNETLTSKLTEGGKQPLSNEDSKAITDYSANADISKFDPKTNQNADQANTTMDNVLAINGNTSALVYLSDMLMNLTGILAPLNAVTQGIGNISRFAGSLAGGSSFSDAVTAGGTQPQRPTRAGRPQGPPAVVGFAEGGPVTTSNGISIPTRSNGDNILSTLQTGEIVIPRKGVAAYLDRMKVPGFADGKNLPLANKQRNVSLETEPDVSGLIPEVHGALMARQLSDLNKTTNPSLTNRGLSKVSQVAKAFYGGVTGNNNLSKMGLGAGSGKGIPAFAFRSGQNLLNAGKKASTFGKVNIMDTLSAFGRGAMGDTLINEGMRGQKAGKLQAGAFQFGKANIADTSSAFKRGMGGDTFMNKGMKGQRAGGLQGAAFRTGQLAKNIPQISLAKANILKSGYQANFKPGAGTSMVDKALALGGRSAKTIMKLPGAALNMGGGIGNSPILQKTGAFLKNNSGKLGLLGIGAGAYYGAQGAEAKGFSKGEGAVIGGLTGDLETGLLKGRDGETLSARGKVSEIGEGFSGLFDQEKTPIERLKSAGGAGLNVLSFLDPKQVLSMLGEAYDVKPDSTTGMTMGFFGDVLRGAGAGAAVGGPWGAAVGAIAAGVASATKIENYEPEEIQKETQRGDASMGMLKGMTKAEKEKYSTFRKVNKDKIGKDKLTPNDQMDLFKNSPEGKAVIERLDKAKNSGQNGQGEQGGQGGDPSDPFEKIMARYEARGIKISDKTKNQMKFNIEQGTVSAESYMQHANTGKLDEREAKRQKSEKGSATSGNAEKMWRSQADAAYNEGDVETAARLNAHADRNRDKKAEYEKDLKDSGGSITTAPPNTFDRNKVADSNVNRQDPENPTANSGQVNFAVNVASANGQNPQAASVNFNPAQFEEFRTIVMQKFVDYSSQFDGVNNALRAIDGKSTIPTKATA